MLHLCAKENVGASPEKQSQSQNETLHKTKPGKMTDEMNFTEVLCSKVIFLLIFNSFKTFACMLIAGWANLFAYDFHV